MGRCGKCLLQVFHGKLNHSYHDQNTDYSKQQFFRPCLVTHHVKLSILVFKGGGYQEVDLCCIQVKRICVKAIVARIVFAVVDSCSLRARFPQILARAERAEDSCALSGSTTIDGLQNSGRCPGLTFAGGFSSEESGFD
jgi:hypothetical protein